MASHQHRLSTSDLLSYERKGFLLCRGLLPARDVAAAAAAVADEARRGRLDALRHRVRVLVSEEAAERVRTEAEAERLLKRGSATGVGFFQHFNLHRDGSKGGSSDAAAAAAVRALAFSPSLARTAAALLGADHKKVRLYQTCAFVKEPGHAQTNWHSDLRMAPFDCNDFLTAWVPLRAMAGEGRSGGGGGSGSDSGLVFAAGSHRDFALPFWRSREQVEAADLSERGYELCPQGAMAVGDVSMHHGWLLHAAGGQPRGTPPRAALAVCFFVDGARVRAVGPGGGGGGGAAGRRRGEDEDAESAAAWIGDLRPGAVARHPLLPVVYDGAAAASGGAGGAAAGGGRRGGGGGGGRAGGGGGGRAGGGRGRAAPSRTAARVPQS
jgi:ectoine hydroxylase-related dioxygenase (phytanoyl-CoA dioxygenase family)